AACGPPDVGQVDDRRWRATLACGPARRPRARAVRDPVGRRCGPGVRARARGEPAPGAADAAGGGRSVPASDDPLRSVAARGGCAGEERASLPRVPPTAVEPPPGVPGRPAPEDLDVAAGRGPRACACRAAARRVPDV